MSRTYIGSSIIALRSTASGKFMTLDNHRVSASGRSLTLRPMDISVLLHFLAVNMLRPVPLLLALLTFATNDLAASQRLRSGESYTSRSKLFAITAPAPCSGFESRYVVELESKQGTQFVEEIGLQIRDTGELYRLGVRRLTQEMRQAVTIAEGILPPPALAWLGVTFHLADRAKRTGEWRPASELDTPQTAFGPAVMSVNHVDGGRFLRVSTFDPATRTFVSNDRPAEIVAVVVQSGQHLLYATGQADAGPVDCVQREVWKMLEGLKLSRALTELP